MDVVNQAFLSDEEADRRRGELPGRDDSLVYINTERVVSHRAKPSWLCSSSAAATTVEFSRGETEGLNRWLEFALRWRLFGITPSG